MRLSLYLDAACYWLADHPEAAAYASIALTILFAGMLENPS